ncbi:hypothetical protein ACWGKQ_09445 [Streptomyces sp. NPDC054770]
MKFGKTANGICGIQGFATANIAVNVMIEDNRGVPQAMALWWWRAGSLPWGSRMGIVKIARA